VADLGARARPVSAAVEARGLVRRLGGREVLRGVDLVVPEGTCQGVLGPNGAGKTTLLRVLATLLAPHGGRLALFGRADRAGLAAARGRIGAVLHGSFLVGALSVEANLLFYARLYGVPDARARVDSALDRLGLRDRRREPAATLSRGLLQRADLARALLHDPALLLLDEPFTGLDAESAARVEEILLERRRKGAAVVLVAHDVERLLRLADRVAVLDRGRIAFEGSAGEVREGAAALVGAGGRG
jgi:heme exporter protein A